MTCPRRSLDHCKRPGVWRRISGVSGSRRAERLDGPGGGCSQERLELRESFLDGIEVGAVGRKKTNARADRFDRLASFIALMAAQIGDHDNIARHQRWRENPLHIVQEPRAVD